MQVILLERIGRLGQMGDVVNVKDGYARNFLLPQKKALRATEDNLKRFENEPRPARGAQPRAQEGGRGGRRQARRQDLRRHPPGRRHRPALRLGDDARHRRGRHRRRLHHRPPPGRARPADQDAGPPRRPASRCIPRSIVQVSLNVARSEDEAERQARGEDVTVDQGGGRCELETFNPTPCSRRRRWRRQRGEEEQTGGAPTKAERCAA